MLPHLQQHFTKNIFSAEKHVRLMSSMNAKLGHDIEFRVMEAPAFVNNELRKQIADAATELVMQCATPEYKAISNDALKAEYTAPNEAARPMFAVVDFAVTQENGRYVPKLVELQGFPSLFGYQLLLSDSLRDTYQFDDSLQTFFSDISRDEYSNILERAVVGTHHPDNVCLLEYKPLEQKTLPDFIATQEFINVAPTDIMSVRKVGNVLFHERGGAWQPIKRIYNRAIVDELEDAQAQLPFSWTDQLDVEWAGHPNWYFRMSKYSLPYLNHSSVPETMFVDEIESIPYDLMNFVLKPLYAFAGKGVNVNPTQVDIDAIPAEQQHNWVLMEKIHYAECLHTPLGMNKLEIRCMMVWLDEWERPLPTISLVRTGRGAMMGARFNNIEWTGANLCLFGEE